MKGPGMDIKQIGVPLPPNGKAFSVLLHGLQIATGIFQSQRSPDPGGGSAFQNASDLLIGIRKDFQDGVIPQDPVL